MPLVVVLKKGEIFAVALPRGRVERRGDRAAVAFDKSNPEPIGQSFRDTHKGTLVESNHDLKGHAIRQRLGSDRRDRLLKKKPSGLFRIRERLEQRGDYDGNRCQSGPPGYS